jgi:hypothetical protein
MNDPNSPDDPVFIDDFDADKSADAPQRVPTSAGAIMALRLNPRGWRWLRGALLAAIVFEAIYAVPVVLVQRETQVVMSEMMPKVLEAQQGANRQVPGLNGVMSTFFSAVGIFSLIFALGWLAAKIVFCAVSLRYLRKPEIQALFQPPDDVATT